VREAPGNPGLCLLSLAEGLSARTSHYKEMSSRPGGGWRMYDHRVGFLQIEQSSFQVEARQCAVVKWRAGGTVAFLCL